MILLYVFLDTTATIINRRAVVVVHVYSIVVLMNNEAIIRVYGMYRILTEFKVFMYWKDPPRANRDAEPRSANRLRYMHSIRIPPRIDLSYVYKLHVHIFFLNGTVLSIGPDRQWTI